MLLSQVGVSKCLADLEFLARLGNLSATLQASPSLLGTAVLLLVPSDQMDSNHT